ncbi:MAG: hypothetical protein HeimC3_34370 [Candidatus Heimdallarchaeota archaeon LC_3]|nr:MAG: hypothetical protein HeimC3_34370 [Candidatus Heimdallarchaeota archaeon LC_3]
MRYKLKIDLKSSLKTNLEKITNNCIQLGKDIIEHRNKQLIGGLTLFFEKNKITGPIFSIINIKEVKEEKEEDWNILNALLSMIPNTVQELNNENLGINVAKINTQREYTILDVKEEKKYTSYKDITLPDYWKMCLTIYSQWNLQGLLDISNYWEKRQRKL